MSATTTNENAKPRFASLFDNFDLVIAILLGVVSIATAYASFQAALYDSKMAGAYSQGNALATEAESLYLEGNQQFLQDTQVFNQLSLLEVRVAAGDALAQEEYDTLYFQGVSDEFGAAIDRAAAQSDDEFFFSPLDDEEYQDFLFSGWSDTKDESVATITEGDSFNSYSDKLTLYTVLLSISLFLLGIAALIRRRRTQLVLVATGVGISLVAIVLTLTIPFVGL